MPHPPKRPGADKATQDLEARLRAGRVTYDDPQAVQHIREQLHEEFSPRCERALARYASRLSQVVIGDVRCLVVEPREVETNDVFLYFFGGGYISGAPEYEMPIVAHLACKNAIKVVLPYYSLAPENPLPQALLEAFRVYEALRQTAREKIILGGESAGGGLAMCLFAELDRRSCRLPDALCLFSPWLDLTQPAHQLAVTLDDPTADAAFLEFCANAACPADLLESFSPALRVPPRSLPATYISSGSRDIMSKSLTKFAKLCAANGLPVHLNAWSEMWHVFELYDELPAAAAALDQASAFISKQLSV